MISEKHLCFCPYRLKCTSSILSLKSLSSCQNQPEVRMGPLLDAAARAQITNVTSFKTDRSSSFTLANKVNLGENIQHSIRYCDDGWCWVGSPGLRPPPLQDLL
ncbi:unnamed protein product [Pleuronectes platessa]|uniref:Uncharacterized protein n=1 Tax=Pleuronectes platessa TaxID=8262 RepID=A0A9N7YAZ2_PLEPL|nr:unnamed protein product [Pleuronectes platessa]